MPDAPLGASFRDPAGFVFQHDGVNLRQVNRGYAEHYDALMASGLQRRLVDRGLVVDHEEVEPPRKPGAEHYRTLRPERVAFVSYPYEWCFWDLGANPGAMTRLAARRCDHVVGFDVDPACLERSWRSAREGDEKNVLPLVMDLTNPSPIGWANRERHSFFERERPDFPDYTREGFEAAFQHSWTIEAIDPIEGSERVLYRMRRRDTGQPDPQSAP